MVFWKGLNMIAKKLVIVALMMGVLSAALAAAAPALAAHRTAHTPAASKKLIVVIGFAPPGYNEATKQWQNGYNAAAKKIATRYTVQYKYAAQITFDPTQLVNLINAAMALHPAGIVIDSSAGPATESTLETAVKAGVKIVAVDNPLPGLAGLSSYVGTNNLAAGRLAAKAMVAAYKAGKMTSNQVAILGSTPGSASLDQRTQGFMAGLKGSGLHIVANVAPTCDIAKAESDLADIITAHPHLGGMFGNCGQDAQGGAQTLVNRKQAGCSQRDDRPTRGHDPRHDRAQGRDCTRGATPLLHDLHGTQHGGSRARQCESTGEHR